MKEVLNKNTIDTTNNTISFLNNLLEDDLNTTGIKGQDLSHHMGKKGCGKEPTC